MSQGKRVKLNASPDLISYVIRMHWVLANFCYRHNSAQREPALAQWIRLHPPIPSLVRIQHTI